MLEEYRIGLFYQQMKGREKISAKRLERSFTELETKLGVSKETYRKILNYRSMISSKYRSMV